MISFLLGAFGVLVLAEVSLRAYARSNGVFLSRLRENDLLSVKVAPMGEFGFRQKPNTSIQYSNGSVATANSHGYRGPEVSRTKPAGTIRIILAGGSSTHGWGVTDDQTIDAYMRRELSARHPGGNFEVLNLAFDGYDSFQDYERIRLEGLAYDPDAIVLNNGINDVRNARYQDLEDPDPRTLLWRGVVTELRKQEVRGGPGLKARLKHWFYILQFIGVIRAAGRHERWASQNPEERDPEPNHGAFDYFERNVRRVAKLAAERDIALLLSTSPSSISTNFAPDATSVRDYWIGNATQTEDLRRRVDARMRSVAAELSNAGQRVAAVEHDIPSSTYLDDAHLTPGGNEILAREFCDGLEQLLGFGDDALLQRS